MKLSIETPFSSTLEVLLVSEKDLNPGSKAGPHLRDLKDHFKAGLFKGTEKSLLFLPFFTEENKHLLLVGLGSNPNYETLRQAGARLFKKLKEIPESKACIRCESLFNKSLQTEAGVQALVEGMLLASYECKEFQLKPKKEKTPKKKLEAISLSFSSKKQEKQAAEGLKQGKILADSTNTIKRICNYPGNLMTPSKLAKEAQDLTKNTKVKTTVWNKARIKQEKMQGLYGVALGSSEEPRFIIMEYRGAAAKEKPVCLVGKGLTFDSGGISLKPANAMDEMKFDMCGSAAVLGSMLAIEKLKLKVNVLALIPSSENMPGQSANKPGDILRARNGKTMEVLNTDAEGRLILADALSYACEQKPQAIFDAATLTGAIIMALGNIFTGFFTKNDRLAQKIQKASDKTGERVWRLPLTKEHTRDVKSTMADVCNISSTRGAGSSTAAAFLEHFVESDIPWAHFDIAGTAWNVSNRLEYCSPRQASGVMVRTFVELVKSFQKNRR